MARKQASAGTRTDAEGEGGRASGLRTVGEWSFRIAGSGGIFVTASQFVGTERTLDVARLWSIRSWGAMTWAATLLLLFTVQWCQFGDLKRWLARGGAVPALLAMRLVCAPLTWWTYFRFGVVAPQRSTLPLVAYLVLYGLTRWRSYHRPGLDVDLRWCRSIWDDLDRFIRDVLDRPRRRQASRTFVARASVVFAAAVLVPASVPGSAQAATYRVYTRVASSVADLVGITR